MDMRMRIPELFAEKKLSPYRVSLDSNGRISMSTAYRLKRVKGRLDTYKNDMIEALCDILDVTPGELFERDKPKRRAG
jgi:DNA-binding Xre family transcriptional regulator